MRLVCAANMRCSPRATLSLARATCELSAFAHGHTMKGEVAGCFSIGNDGFRHVELCVRAQSRGVELGHGSGDAFADAIGFGF